MILLYKAQIYCMFILAVLLFMCLVGIKQRSKENKIFNMLLVFAMVNMCFDIASNYTVNHLETVSDMVNRVVHICFFVSLTTLFLLVYKYLVALVEKELERELKGKYLTYLPYVILFIIVLFLPIYYMEEESGNYSYGPGPNMVYACVAIYVILIIEVMIRHRKNISRKNKMAIILALACELGAAFFQMFNPAALTSSLGVTLLCLCTYMTVANPDAVLVGLLKEETARADKANRAKSDFLAKVSHEIRTPINAVLGMNEMILRESKESNIRKYSRDVKSSANALLSLINEILDSSKIESGKMEIIPVEYEASSVLNDLYNMINVKAKDKGLELVFDIDKDIPVGYYGDDIRIKQILINLLNNAVKYTHEGTVTLKVMGRKDGENEVLHFEVKDTGIGIKEEDIEKLFSKYDRIEEERNRHIEGTGLGMNIAIQLLKLMDSELVVKSRYGVGSKFSFELVQRIVNEESLGDFRERIEKVSRETNYEISYIAPEAKILVVDDNQMNIKVFKSLIKQTKIQVYEATSGSQCLEIMKNQKVDMVFLDHMMPDMDGIETYHIMKEKGLCRDIPVIMLTANAVTGAKEQYLNEGFNDFLTKPIMPDKLDKMIVTYLAEELIRKDDLEKESVNETKTITLMEPDEFDFGYAMGILNSEELLIQTLKDFRMMLNNLPMKLSALTDTITDEDSLKTYRIEVHSLKSSAATVGALLLSKLARILEVAAADGEIEKIVTLNPILIEEMEKHKQRIDALFPEDVKEETADMEQIKAYFEMLKMSLLNDDYSTADFVIGEIKKYKYDDEMQRKVEKLADMIMNLEGSEAIKCMEEMSYEKNIADRKI